ncbi:hypothetical protein D7147_23180 [Micromonospora musae]|uniref:Uncharacterized protein n=1 Tax=Micromonospora musae TaxID=1894970 RepID=A0ABX9R355_9ACTN|nr:hypothetical protein [Micromonospora musae]RKN16696.1 hypothetical protein D7147_23180 [Micromonospora musae]
MSASDVVAVDLTSDERFLLRRGLAEWGGPAHSTDDLARAMGFRDQVDLYHGEGRRLREALDRGEPLSRSQWRKLLFSTEIVFASDVVGSGSDWSITTGLSDEETIKLLRVVQRKVARALRMS